MTQLALDLVADLPPYTVRESARARQVRLTVSARDGLVVTVPRGFPTSRVEPIVVERREWAERALAGVAERRALFAAGAWAMIPAEVVFPSTLERFLVVREPGAGRVVRARERAGELVLTGAVGDPDACLGALQRWLGAAAKERLGSRAWELAHAHGFEPAEIRVKKQRHRWGSCSARGAIALNRALLFLEPELVDAVILHEFVHMRRLDHSAAFWRDLARLDPRAEVHRQRLREAAELVPPWADA